MRDKLIIRQPHLSAKLCQVIGRIHGAIVAATGRSDRPGGYAPSVADRLINFPLSKSVLIKFVPLLCVTFCSTTLFCCRVRVPSVFPVLLSLFELQHPGQHK